MTYAQVIQHFGSQIKAAAALGLTRQAISLWKTHGIKADRQKFIAVMTRGKLKAEK